MDDLPPLIEDGSHVHAADVAAIMIALCVLVGEDGRCWIAARQNTLVG
jgi:hypothetical protein